MIDSQSVKTTESGGPRGYDAGKKIKGRKLREHALDAVKAIVGMLPQDVPGQQAFAGLVPITHLSGRNALRAAAPERSF